MRSRFPHGGEVLGAAPANPILAPVLSQDRGLRMSRQRGLLDLQAIQRLPGLVGYWKNDPQYLFEDSAGTIPASTSGTGPVGKWSGTTEEALGSELIANGTFDTNTTGWTVKYGTGTIASVGGALVLTATSTEIAYQAISTVVGKQYRIRFQAISYAPSSGFYAVIKSDNNSATLNAIDIGNMAFGNVSGDFVATSTTTYILLQANGTSSFTASWDNISVREVISGVTAFQSTTANKPILRKTPATGIYWTDSNTSTSALNVALSDTVLGRRNLLTYSEQLDNAVWVKSFSSISANSEYDPSGQATYDKLVEDTSTVSTHQVYCSPFVIGAVQTVSVDVKADTRSSIYIMCGASSVNAVTFNAQTNVFSTIGPGVTNTTSTLLSNGAYRVSFTMTPASMSMRIYLHNGTTTSYTGDGTSGLYIGRIQVEPGSVATDYQKITNVPAYLTLARSTPEGVVFTDNAEIANTYNIAPAFSFNADVAIFNRALTATEKALITRYMQRAVPMLGSNVVTNGTFDTDTVWTKGTGWSIGSGIASKSAGTASNLTQSVGVSGNAYYAKADVIVTAGTIGAYPGSGTTQFGSTSATGTLAYTMKASGTGIGVRGNASFAGSVDNATIKEIL